MRLTFKTTKRIEKLVLIAEGVVFMALLLVVFGAIACLDEPWSPPF